MKHTQLPDLEKVTNAAFQKHFQALRPILEAEARIQQQLARLDSQLNQARQDSAKIEGYQVSGTDVLWNGWEVHDAETIEPATCPNARAETCRNGSFTYSFWAKTSRRNIADESSAG